MIIDIDMQKFLKEKKKELIYRKAELAVKVAGLILPNGEESLIEDQATELMYMRTKHLKNLFKRLKSLSQKEPIKES